MPRKKQRKAKQAPLSLFPMNFGQAVDRMLTAKPAAKPKRKTAPKKKARKKK